MCDHHLSTEHYMFRWSWVAIIVHALLAQKICSVRTD
jgi:hypothetical protein